VVKNRLTPDTLTERWLRDLGWTVDQCHRKVGPVNKDLFGFADQMAFSSEQIMLVQSTSYSNISARRGKILGNRHAAAWIGIGGGYFAKRRILVVGWKLTKDPPEPVVNEMSWEQFLGELVWDRVKKLSDCAPEVYDLYLNRASRPRE